MGTIIDGVPSRNVAASEQKLIWAPIYEAVLSILGATAVIIPMGDTKHENGGRTSVTTLGEEAKTFAYSEAITAFDTPPYLKGPGRIPIITFNGTDEEADTPDAAYWSRDDEGGANGFSIGIWANTPNAGARCLMAKYDETGGSEAREWIFFINPNDTLRLFLYDESADEAAYRNTNATIPMGSMTFFVATYDGTGGGMAADGVALYVNGAVVASSPTSAAQYAGMEGLGGVVSLGRNIGGERFFPGEMAGGPLGPVLTHAELTPDQICRLYHLGRAALDV